MKFIDPKTPVRRSIITVKRAVRVGWLGNKTLAPGVYAMEGDVSVGLKDLRERRKVLAGFYSIEVYPADKKWTPPRKKAAKKPAAKKKATKKPEKKKEEKLGGGEVAEPKSVLDSTDKVVHADSAQESTSPEADSGENQDNGKEVKTDGDEASEGSGTDGTVQDSPEEGEPAKDGGSLA